MLGGVRILTDAPDPSSMPCMPARDTGTLQIARPENYAQSRR